MNQYYLYGIRRVEEIISKHVHMDRNVKADRVFFTKLENNRLVGIPDRFISSNLTTFIKGRFILGLEIGMFQPMHACIMVHWSCLKYILHLGVPFLLSLDIFAPYNGTLRVYICVCQPASFFICKITSGNK